MMALLLSWLPQLLGAAGLIAGGTALYVGVRKSGEKAQQAADAQQTIKEMENRDAVQNAVDREPADSVNKQLRDKWTK